MSQNVLYYHSELYELITVLFFVLGSFNFALHYTVLHGNKKELRRNIELISFTITVTILTLLTFCVLELRNGFTVTGESACASPENFDAEIGRKIARANAINKVWPLMGYELRTNLAGGAQ